MKKDLNPPHIAQFKDLVLLMKIRSNTRFDQLIGTKFTMTIREEKK